MRSPNLPAKPLSKASIKALRADSESAYAPETTVTHPVFDYRLSLRRVLETQARLLVRHLQGEIPVYPEFLTR